jgi:hypothetical protein
MERESLKQQVNNPRSVLYKEVVSLLVVNIEGCLRNYLSGWFRECPCSLVVRTLAFQAGGDGFDSRQGFQIRLVSVFTTNRL